MQISFEELMLASLHSLKMRIEAFDQFNDQNRKKNYHRLNFLDDYQDIVYSIENAPFPNDTPLTNTKVKALLEQFPRVELINKPDQRKARYRKERKLSLIKRIRIMLFNYNPNAKILSGSISEIKRIIDELINIYSTQNYEAWLEMERSNKS